MGKPRFVRVSNCGFFPRWRLASVGSSSKRGEKMQDASQGGWFGSGTKIAPIAALALGMEVWVTSTDEHGTYLVTYEVGEGPGGAEDPRVFRVFHEGTTHRREMTEFSPASFIKWSTPIGDDPLREFRIWREYVRNARDADPVAPYFDEADAPLLARNGITAVYLTKTNEYETIRQYPDRYFKYLANGQALYLFPGIGKVWPKSEDSTTRMFSLGTMALCSRSSSWSTLYDYDFERKDLMSEERIFENMSEVLLELSRMLAGCTNALLTHDWLKAMIEGRAALECQSLANIGPKTPIPGKEKWVEAWARLNGNPNAVIAMGNWSDQHARVSFGKTPVVVASHTLRTFLTYCGVPRSIDVIPKADQDEYEVVEPTREELAVLREAFIVLLPRYPEMGAVPVYVYEPCTEEMRQGIRGFCLPKIPPYTDVYIRRDRLQPGRDDQGEDDPLRKAVRTLNHEFRHVRTGAFDGTPELMWCADADETDWLIALHRGEEAGWRNNWQEPVPDPDPVP